MSTGIQTWMPQYTNIVALFSTPGSPPSDKILRSYRMSWSENNFVASLRANPNVTIPVNLSPFESFDEYQDFMLSHKLWIFLPLAIITFLIFSWHCCTPYGLCWSNKTRGFDPRRWWRYSYDAMDEDLDYDTRSKYERRFKRRQHLIRSLHARDLGYDPDIMDFPDSSHTLNSKDVGELSMRSHPFETSGKMTRVQMKHHLRESFVDEKPLVGGALDDAKAYWDYENMSIEYGIYWERMFRVVTGFLIATFAFAAFWWFLFKVNDMTHSIGNSNVMAILYLFAIWAVVIIGVARMTTGILTSTVEDQSAAIRLANDRHVRIPTPDAMEMIIGWLLFFVAAAVFYEGSQINSTSCRNIFVVASFILFWAALSRNFWWASLYPFMHGDIGIRSFNPFEQINSNDRHMRNFAEGQRWFLICLASILILSVSRHDALVLVWTHVNDDNTWYRWMIWLAFFLMLALLGPVSVLFLYRLAIRCKNIMDVRSSNVTTSTVITRTRKSSRRGRRPRHIRDAFDEDQGGNNINVAVARGRGAVAWANGRDDNSHIHEQSTASTSGSEDSDSSSDSGSDDNRGCSDDGFQDMDKNLFGSDSESDFAHQIEDSYASFGDAINHQRSLAMQLRGGSAGDFAPADFDLGQAAPQNDHHHHHHHHHHKKKTKSKSKPERVQQGPRSRRERRNNAPSNSRRGRKPSLKRTRRFN